MREAIQAWLDAQCSDLQGVSDAVIMLVPRGGQVRLAAAATWPRGVKASDELQAAAVKAFDAQVPSVTPLAQPGRRRRSVIAHPVQVGSRTVGAVAIAMHAQARSGTQVVLAGVERGAVNFESFLRRWRTAHAAPAPGDTFFKTGAFTAPAAAMAASEPSAASRTHQAPLSGNRRNRAITFRLTSLSRISPWLVGLLILLVPFGALLVGLLPDRSDVARQVSERTAESLAARVLLTLLLASAGLSVFYLYMRQVLRRTAVTPIRRARCSTHCPRA